MTQWYSERDRRCLVACALADPKLRPQAEFSLTPQGAEIFDRLSEITNFGFGLAFSIEDLRELLALPGMDRVIAEGWLKAQFSRLLYRALYDDYNSSQPLWFFEMLVEAGAGKYFGILPFDYWLRELVRSQDLSDQNLALMKLLLRHGARIEPKALREYDLKLPASWLEALLENSSRK